VAVPGPWMAVADGRLLRRLRTEQGLTQAGLARLARVSVSTVSKLERSLRPVCHCAALSRLADALGAEVRELALAVNLRNRSLYPQYGAGPGVPGRPGVAADDKL
jgi:transcriptional regulator with XRE-family HTH domain